MKAVQNHIGDMDQKPMSVHLRPGKYLVYALAPGYGRITVPVLIIGARQTDVYLEREGMPALQKVKIPESELVHLPDGRVLGRRAEADQKVNN